MEGGDCGEPCDGAGGGVFPLPPLRFVRGRHRVLYGPFIKRLTSESKHLNRPQRWPTPRRPGPVRLKRKTLFLGFHRVTATRDPRTCHHPVKLPIPISPCPASHGAIGWSIRAVTTPGGQIMLQHSGCCNRKCSSDPTTASNSGKDPFWWSKGWKRSFFSLTCIACMILSYKLP